MNVLTIGNSFTWSLRSCFPAIAEDQGEEQSHNSKQSSLFHGRSSFLFSFSFDGFILPQAVSSSSKGFPPGFSFDENRGFLFSDHILPQTVPAASK